MPQDYEELIDDTVSPIYDKGYKKGFEDGYNKALEEYKDVIAEYNAKIEREKQKEDNLKKAEELLGIPCSYYHANNPPKDPEFVREIYDLRFNENKSISEIAKIKNVTVHKVNDNLIRHLRYKSIYKRDCIKECLSEIEDKIKNTVFEKENSLSEQEKEDLKKECYNLYFKVYDSPCPNYAFSFNGKGYPVGTLCKQMLQLSVLKDNSDFAKEQYNKRLEDDEKIKHITSRDYVADKFDFWFENTYALKQHKYVVAQNEKEYKKIMEQGLFFKDDKDDEEMERD